MLVLGVLSVMRVIGSFREGANVMSYNSSISAVKEEAIAHSAILLLSIGFPLGLTYLVHAPIELTVLVCLPGIVAEIFSAVAMLGGLVRSH